jgi:CRP-like cAMP-binding protein
MELPKYITNNIKLSPQKEAELYSYFEKLEFKKGEFLYEQGSVCRSIFFIKEGLARAFYYSDSGKEITGWFALENEFITAFDSFYYKTVTNINCELLEDTILYALSTADLELLLEKDHDFAKIAFNILSQITMNIVEFMGTLKFQTAKERYLFLTEKHPQIPQRVTLQHIASYLGITRETLSRLRAEL